MDNFNSIKSRATDILKTLYGLNATFRDGQLEAILSTMTNKRTLVVQKTGWGKSLIYFICTKLLKEEHNGITFVVSPLIGLMMNQMSSAEKLNLKCDSINSITKDRRSEIIDKMKSNELDIIFITPESLFSPDIQQALKDIRICLFVIDEAHCISDWGHDFRLEYGNLIKVIKFLPQNVPLLATTATANNRVIEDLNKQFGNDCTILRGPLSRNNLAIQILKLESLAERYAWILKNINKLSGSGIIYCLTKHDCEHLYNFLHNNNINVRTYFSKKDESENIESLSLFENNQIKAIISTNKLGMGFDKPDIGFVIHFQRPKDIVSYYQQIGRAGRNLDNANIFLMTGKEDLKINNHFINTAFPTKKECEQVINEIENNDGTTIYYLLHRLNIRRNRLEKAIDFLLNQDIIYKDKNKYYVTANEFYYDEEYYNKITQIRHLEQRQIEELTKTKECLNKFIVNALDDFTAKNCNICSNCKNEDIIDSSLSINEIEKALTFIKNLQIPIEPRKMWPKTLYTENSKIEFINEYGICLSKYGDAGYGELVQRDKYQNNSFCEELLEKSASVLKNIIQEKHITHITNVPSLRSSIVEDFAQKLANKLNVKYINLLTKSPANPQKLMENSSFQCQNAFESFEVIEQDFYPENILLVDDIIDSKWTITVCGYKLRAKGVLTVTPFALADSSVEV